MSNPLDFNVTLKELEYTAEFDDNDGAFYAYGAKSLFFIFYFIFVFWHFN